MHAATNRLPILALAAIVAFGTLGCRGSSPFGSMVRVTHEDTSANPDIDAPQQRLATTKPRTPPADGAAQANSVSTAGAVSTAPSSQTVAQTAAIQPSDGSVVAKSNPANLAMKRSMSSVAPNSVTPTDNDAVSTSVEKRIDASVAALVDKRERSLPTSEDLASIELPTGNAEELMLAFKDYPPEVQREALRRLVAATARSAERSNQPQSITASLQDRTSDLPNLPNASDGDPNVPAPKRIATDRSASSSSLSTAIPNRSQREPNSEPVESRVTDLDTGELQPKIVSVANTHESANAIESASATGSAKAIEPAHVADANDKATVAQVSMDNDLNDLAAETSLDDRDSVSIDPLAELSHGQLFEKLVQKLATAPSGESDADRASRMIKLRHLMVLSGDPDGAVEQVDGMTEAEQEYLRHQLLGLWTMIDPQGHPVASRRFSTAISQIREAAKFAAAATDSLEVRSLAFCTEIESYGQIKPFKNNRFEPGQQVILYCEIENFTANETEEGFETHLQGSYDLFNENDEKVVSQLLPEDQQVSANYLRDYFIAYQMHLPEQLRKGKYRLQLTMEDVNGKKYGQSSIPVEIK